MASSFIRRKENGFWIQDSLIQVIAIYIALTISKQVYRLEWLEELKDDYKYIGWGYSPGFVNFGIDDKLTNDDRVFIYLKILDETIFSLGEKGDFITKDELNSYREEDQGEWLEGLEVDRLINILVHLKKLVRGELKIKDSDPIEYSF